MTLLIADNPSVTAGGNKNPTRRGFQWMCFLGSLSNAENYFSQLNLLFYDVFGMKDVN